jgi:hypothetical protein
LCIQRCVGWRSPGLGPALRKIPPPRGCGQAACWCSVDVDVDCGERTAVGRRPVVKLRESRAQAGPAVGLRPGGMTAGGRWPRRSPTRTYNERLEPATGAFRPRGVRISLIGLPVAAVFLAGFTSACSAQNPADGTLTGHLYGVGGPAPGLPRPWPGTVTVTGPGVHRDVPVGARATYSVTVPAGRYTLVGHSPLYGSGAGLCQAAGVATVTSGHTTKADVLCQMS